jgi:hypothetical protein
MGGTSLSGWLHPPRQYCVRFAGRVEPRGGERHPTHCWVLRVRAASSTSLHLRVAAQVLAVSLLQTGRRLRALDRWAAVAFRRTVRVTAPGRSTDCAPPVP